ncbi:MAG: hypothetical protein JW943_13195 [Deltaproteobacteria bacterium]|nr:hypothetical protein [Deltaproteobacteria bacterium]
MDSFQVFKPDIEIQNNIHKLHAYGIDLRTTNSCVTVASWITGRRLMNNAA